MLYYLLWIHHAPALMNYAIRVTRFKTNLTDAVIFMGDAYHAIMSVEKYMKTTDPEFSLLRHAYDFVTDDGNEFYISVEELSEDIVKFVLRPETHLIGLREVKVID